MDRPVEAVAVPDLGQQLELGLLPTASGRWVDPFALTVADVCVEDILFGLAHECRWTSQLTRFYSVAQHSVLVSLHVPAAKAFPALLHDAGEAWLHDLAPQFRARIPGYNAAMRAAQDAVAARFGLAVGFELDPEILAVDEAIRVDELRQLKGIAVAAPALGIDIRPAVPQHAAAMFADRFFQLWRAWG